MLSAWYFSLPAITRWLFTGMSLLLVLTVFARDPLNYCLNTGNLAGLFSLHGLLTLFVSTYTHLAFFHLFWNMSVLVYYGGIYERKWGSMKFLLNTILFGLLCNLLHVAVAFVITSIPMPIWIKSNLVYTCSLGFSGVLFFLISIDCFDPKVSSSEGQQVFGLMPVPKKYYPWIMLALMQLMIKNVSFIGHLAGLLLGLMYARDNQHLLHLRSHWIEYLEQTTFCQTLLEPRAAWIPKTQLPGKDIPDTIPFSQALQQQFQSFYPLRPQPEGNLGDRPLPATAPQPTSGSNVTSFSQLPRGPPSNNSQSHGNPLHLPPSGNPSSSGAATNGPKFPGQGHTLGR